MSIGGKESEALFQVILTIKIVKCTEK